MGFHTSQEDLPWVITIGNTTIWGGQTVFGFGFSSVK
jgi:hypothetical protein